MEFEQIKRVSYERHCGLRGLDDDIKDLDLHFIQFLLVSVLTHELLWYLQRECFAELIRWFQTRIHVLSSRMSRASCGFGWFDSGWMVRKDEGKKKRERDSFNWSAWVFYYFGHAHTHKQHISHFPFIAYNYVARPSPSLDSTHTQKLPQSPEEETATYCYQIQSPANLTLSWFGSLSLSQPAQDSLFSRSNGCKRVYMYV